MAHEHFQSCIDACNSCAAACDHCAVACLQEDDVRQMARCIQLDLDCAEICQLAARYMARSSELAIETCAHCADICEACAKECERHSSMKHCMECAKACRHCAQECRQMAAKPRPKQRPGAAAH